MAYLINILGLALGKADLHRLDPTELTDHLFNLGFEQLLGSRGQSRRGQAHLNLALGKADLPG
jgi:hypothetical protein